MSTKVSITMWPCGGCCLSSRVHLLIYSPFFKKKNHIIESSCFIYIVEILLLLQASDHIATTYAELRDGSANAKV
jgi:hypothetical protein